jgi:MFS family permease
MASGNFSKPEVSTEILQSGLPTENHADTYPKGGLEAWGVVFGSFCCLLCVFGMINSAAVFELHFSENQLSDHSHTQISWIFSLYLFTVYFLGTLAGPVFDVYGHRLLVLVGSVCLVVRPMLLSIATSKRVATNI